MKLLAEKSHRAVGLDPRPSDTAQMVDDLSDRSKLKTLLVIEKITHVVRAGGVSGPMVLANDPVEVIAINVLGSLNLLYAAMESGVRTFIYCSSVAALGSFMKTNRSTNNIPCAPITHAALPRPRWRWCCADCGAKSRWTFVRCGSP
jgi:nucleoside-diphosphate-sugar epimerase